MGVGLLINRNIFPEIGVDVIYNGEGASTSLEITTQRDYDFICIHWFRGDDNSCVIDNITASSGVQHWVREIDFAATNSNVRAENNSYYGYNDNGAKIPSGTKFTFSGSGINGVGAVYCLGGYLRDSEWAWVIQTIISSTSFTKGQTISLGTYSNTNDAKIKNLFVDSYWTSRYPSDSKTITIIPILTLKDSTTVTLSSASFTGVGSEGNVTKVWNLDQYQDIISSIECTLYCSYASDGIISIDTSIKAEQEEYVG